MNAVVDRKNRIIEDPPMVRNIFGNPTWSWIFIPIRLYLAYNWLNSGWGKFTNPKWIGDGSALQAYWQNAVAVNDAGRGAITFGWYRDFLQLLLNMNAAPWFAKLVLFGELAVGIGLLLGLFTGIAAFGGTLLNLNFMLAGSASTNPLMFGFATLIVLGWKVAGYWGLDRWVLPALGVPWKTVTVEEYGAQRTPTGRPAAQH